MKDELEKKKKVNKLKEYAKAASTADLPNMAKKAVQKVAKATNIKNIASQIGGKSIGQKAKETYESTVKGTTTIKKRK